MSKMTNENGTPQIPDILNSAEGPILRAKDPSHRSKTNPSTGNPILAVRPSAPSVPVRARPLLLKTTRSANKSARHWPSLTVPVSRSAPGVKSSAISRFGKGKGGQTTTCLDGNVIAVRLDQVNADENRRFPEPTEPVASLSEIQSAGQAVNEGTNSVPHLITLPEDLERLKAARFEQSHNFGRNELSAIEVCHAYVQAQRQHVVRDRSGRGIMQYARKIRSTPGKRDGLYWDAKLGQEQSPFGLAMATAHPESTARKTRPGPVQRVQFHSMVTSSRF